MQKILLIIFIAVLNWGIAAPQFGPFGLPMFNKCYVAGDACPNENVTFWLYTRSTQDSPQQLNMADPQSVTSANYAQGRPYVVLIHGYTGDKDYSPNSHIRPALFQNDDYNVISIDYHPLAPEPCYVQAVHNLPVVAKCTAQLLDYMMEKQLFTLDDLHIIGFSLGAQTAGMISNFVKTGKLRRLVGLDPAKPMFILADNDHKLGPDDADYVQVVHTDSFARGVLAAAGHQDFYMNGGIEQPGCYAQRNQSNGSCNHDRAPIYFAESQSTRKLVSGASNAKNGKIGLWDCVDIPMNRRLWAGKQQTSLKAYSWSTQIMNHHMHKENKPEQTTFTTKCACTRKTREPMNQTSNSQ